MAAGVEVGTNDVLVIVSVWVQVIVMDVASVMAAVEVEAAFEVGGGVVVLFEVGCTLDVEDDETWEVELDVDKEVEEIVVLLLTMGTARTEPARTARMKEIDTCIFVDVKSRSLRKE